MADDNTWLVVIDMQEIFAHPGQWWGCPRFGEIIDRRSASAARAAVLI